MTDAATYPQPTLDFRGDPARVKWTKYVGDSCAYCGAPIPEEAVPLHLFRQDGTGAQFCDPCAEICFGVIGFMEDEGQRPAPAPYEPLDP